MVAGVRAGRQYGRQSWAEWGGLQSEGVFAAKVAKRGKQNKGAIHSDNPIPRRFAPTSGGV